MLTFLKKLFARDGLGASSEKQIRFNSTSKDHIHIAEAFQHITEQIPLDKSVKQQLCDAIIQYRNEG